ncbi:MAG: tetratricopeptide repeat protein [Armatimonadetes bacterium]|nr:tetratricopeptide repeat protein [Armatimonadota bacterium]
MKRATGQGRQEIALILATLMLPVLAGTAWAQVVDQAEKDFAFAQGLYRQENYGLAAEKFAAFVKAYPTHANMSLALFRAGECLFRTGKHGEAAPYFEQLTQKYPDSAEAEPGWVWLGDAYFQSQQYEKAASAYKSYLQKYPQGDQGGRAAYWLGESYYHLGNNAEAIAAYEQALGKQLSEQESAYARYALGWAYLQASDTDKALQYLQQVLEKHATSPVAAESQYLIGTAYRTRKEYPAAVAAFQQVLDKFADSKFAAYAQSGIAWCHFEQKEYEAALAAFGQVMARYPGSEPAAEARLRSADCLFHLRRYSEAAPLYEQAAAEKDSKWADEALYWLGVTYQQIPDAADRALAAHERLVAEHPESPRVTDSYVHIGRLHLAAGKTAEAVTAFQRAMDTARTPAAQQQAQANLAWARYQQDKSEANLGEVEKLLQQDPKQPWVAPLAYHVAFAHFTAERFQAALNMLDLIVTNHPEAAKQGDIAYLSGACQDRLGNTTKAEELYRQALQDPRQPEYAGLAGAGLVDLYARQGDVERARQLAEELTQSETTAEAKGYALNAVAEALYKAKRYPDAMATYAEVLKVAPESSAAPYAQLGLAWAKLEAGAADAEEAFLTVSRKYPQSPAAARVPEGLLAIAERLFEAENYPAAQAAYQRLLNDYPASDLGDEAEYKLAWALLRQDKPDEALSHFVAVVPRASSPAVAADARYQAARLLVVKGEVPQAAALLEPFRQEYAETEVTPLALALLGRACLDQKQTEQAASAFRQVLDKYPGSPAAADAWLGLGRVQHLQKQFDPALESLTRALATAQGATAAEAQFIMAMVLRDKGETQKAAEEFLKVSILYGVPAWSARAQYEAGQCYEQLQNKDAAIKSYQVVVRDYPQQTEWVQQAQARLEALGQ